MSFAKWSARSRTAQRAQGASSLTTTIRKCSSVRVIGNPVNVIEAGEDELPELLRSHEGLWAEILRDGQTILGTDIRALRKAA